MDWVVLYWTGLATVTSMVQILLEFSLRRGNVYKRSFSYIKPLTMLKANMAARVKIVSAVVVEKYR